jgi:hypothetical protein
MRLGAQILRASLTFDLYLRKNHSRAALSGIDLVSFRLSDFLILSLFS